MADTRKLMGYNFAGAVGWDLVCSWILPEPRFARRLAWKLTRPGGMYAGLDVKATRFVLNMPRASYEITGYDYRGVATVGPCGAVSSGIGL